MTDGRDPRTGRFRPGHPGGPGRPKVSLRRLAAKVAADRGIDLEDALAEALDTLLVRAQRGNVAASRELVKVLGPVPRREPSPEPPPVRPAPAPAPEPRRPTPQPMRFRVAAPPPAEPHNEFGGLGGGR